MSYLRHHVRKEHQLTFVCCQTITIPSYSICLRSALATILLSDSAYILGIGIFSLHTNGVHFGPHFCLM